MNIQESVNKLLESEEILGDLFYRTFLEKCPEVQEYFKDVNMTSQAALLIASLVIVERYYSLDGTAAEQYLRVLGTRHHSRGIPVDLYPKWTAAMMEALRQFHGDDWSEMLADQWLCAIDQAIERMLEGYEDHYHV